MYDYSVSRAHHAIMKKHFRKHEEDVVTIEIDVYLSESSISFFSCHYDMEISTPTPSK